LPLSAGTVTIDGQPPRRGNAQTGYVPQQRDLDRDLPIRGRDLVQFGVDGHRRGLPLTRARQVGAAIEAVGAQDYADADQAADLSPLAVAARQAGLGDKEITRTLDSARRTGEHRADRQAEADELT
jgi:hypothetical protein